VTATRFDSMRDDHTALRNFLRRMPKGADLHVHLSGAVFAEHAIEWAILDGYCVRTADLTIVPPPCTEGTVAASDAQKDQAFFDRLVNALSMRNFLPTNATPSGHDQFFAAFGRLNIAPHRTFELIMDQLVQRQADGVQYVELMLTLMPARDRQTLAKAIEGETDLATMLDTLKRNGLDRAVEEARRRVVDLIERVNAALDCGSERVKAGCGVSYRFIAQVSRNNPIEEVFVQTAAAAALIRAEPRVVALNFVGPEDHQIDVAVRIGLAACNRAEDNHAGDAR